MSLNEHLLELDRQAAAAKPEPPSRWELEMDNKQNNQLADYWSRLDTAAKCAAQARIIQLLTIALDQANRSIDIAQAQTTPTQEKTEE
jgi:hypothetical protein